jgi:glucokinase
MGWIGIDLGGTKIYGVHVLADGEIGAEAKAKTPPDGPASVVAAIASMITDMDAEGIDGVGLGVPGLIERERGLLIKAPNIAGWDAGFPLVESLSAALGGLAVVLENDVNAGTMAEWRLGAGRGSTEMLGVFVGTGIGAGLVLEGRLRHGAGGNAGELGHMVVAQGGRPCGCGGRGHVESYAGRASMEREARDRAARGHPTILVELAGDKRMTSGVFAQALEDGDALAIELIDQAVQALGAGIASAVSLLDVATVVVGGGLADRLGADFVARVARATVENVFAANEIVILGAELGDRTGAIGAALVAEAQLVGVGAEH